MTGPGSYPHELERSVVLRDGSRIRIRPVRPDDAPRLIALHDRLSEHTAYQRFFTVMRRLPLDWARYLANVDYDRRLALVVEPDTEGEPELLAVGRYEGRAGDEVAEAAFVVQDAWQGKGLGRLLLREVLRAGVARGIRRFRGYVLSDNHRMLGLLTRHTDVLERKVESGVTELLFEPRAAPPAPGPPPATGQPS